MGAVREFAPAKVNLGLRVTGRRPDGYHTLESLFVPLSLGDEITVTRTEPPGITLAVDGDPLVPDDETNLAWRAARAFLDASGATGGVALRIQKRIPAPGGLGGGSSDAGSVLRALAALEPGRVPPVRLEALALTLGADVPYFLKPVAALVEGIGEQITPVAGVAPLWLSLAHPGKTLSTPAVFAAFDAAAASGSPDSLTASDPRPTIRRLLALRGQDARTGFFDEPRAAGWTQLLGNDLESAAISLCPEVAELREEFEATQALAVGMSGSGPTVYGIYSEEEGARRAAGHIEGRTGFRTWVVRTAP